MAQSALATAFVNIVPGTKEVSEYLKKGLGDEAEKAGDDGGKRFGAGLSRGIKGAAVAIGAALAVASAAAVGLAVASVNAAAESDSIARGMENAVRNSKAFGETAADVDRVSAALDAHSTKLAEMSGIDDEIINQIKTGWLAVPDMAAMGVDGINRLAQVSADIAAGTGKDIQSIAMMFTKTAGDEENALGKLTRAGIVLSDSQKATYDSILQTNGEVAAQNYLIETLGTTYAGAAAAAANPFDQLRVIFENLKETIGTAMLPAIRELVPIVSAFIANLTASPEFQSFIESLATGFGEMLRHLMPLGEVFFQLMTDLMPVLVDLFNQFAPIVVALVQAFAPLIGAILPPLAALFLALAGVVLSLMESVILPLIPLVVEVIEAFVPMIDEILPIITDLFESLIPVIADLIKSFIPIIERILPVVTDLFFQLIGPVTRIIDAVLPVLIDLIELLAPVVLDLIEAFMPLIEEVLPLLVDLAMPFVDILVDLLEAILPLLPPLVQSFADSLKWMTNNVLKPLIDGLKSVVEWFTQLLGFNGKSVNVNASTSGQRTALSARIPAMAKGGFVDRPTYALIGEAGPEVVTPLRDFERMMGVGTGSGQTVNYYAAPNQSLDAEQALFTALKRAKAMAW